MWRPRWPISERDRLRSGRKPPRLTGRATRFRDAGIVTPPGPTPFDTVERSSDPDSGVVVPHVGGVREVRWSRPGTGKRGGVRVIYCNRNERGQIWLLPIYAKSALENIPADTLGRIREEMER